MCRRRLSRVHREKEFFFSFACARKKLSSYVNICALCFFLVHHLLRSAPMSFPLSAPRKDMKSKNKSQNEIKLFCDPSAKQRQEKSSQGKFTIMIATMFEIFYLR